MARIYAVIITMLFVSCKQKVVFQNILTNNNLKAQSFTINPSSDTTIVGIRGGRISIPAGAFSIPAGQTVTLTIKEAYSSRDIILAGLATESNGRPLRSGGMIYVDASSGGQSVALTKPINVSIPTDNYQNGMELYKGELKPDSSLNWIKPIPLDSFSIARGEKLYRNCSNCHKIDGDFTGPPLFGSIERAPYPDWGYRFTTGAFRMVKNDVYLNELKRKWKNTVMTVFDISRQDYYDMMKYVYAVADSTKSVNVPDASQSEPKMKGPLSPCDTATVLVQTLYDTIYTDPNNYDLPAAPYPSTLPISDTQPIKSGRSKASDYEGLRSGFTDVGVGSGMYNFEIKTLGWFNVDAEVEGYEGTTIVKVNGKIHVELKMNITLYLFCPRKKMLSVGTVHADNTFSFEKIDGGIPLFNDDLGVLIAFGSYKSQLYVGSAPISVKNNTYKNIPLKPTDERLFYSLLMANTLGGINISCIKLEEKVVPRPAYLPCGDSLP
jgi:cytochrome c2